LELNKKEKTQETPNQKEKSRKAPTKKEKKLFCR
jgi:hypothetical protein